MELTKQQKILIAVLGLGATSLFVDRVIIGSDTTAPQPASAQIEPKTISASPAANSAAEQTPQQSAAQAIADNLNRLAKQHGYDLTNVPDAFTAPEAWTPAGSAAPAPTATSAKALAAVFAKHHELQAVMTGGDRDVALVDGKTYVVGATLDGFTLKTVTSRSAVFAFKNIRVELTLDPLRAPDR